MKKITPFLLLALGFGIMWLFAALPSHTANYHPVHSDGTPTVATCGTSPSVAGTDGAGVITTGSGTVTACTLNFSATLGAAPSCIVTTNSATITPAITSVSTSALVLALSLTLTSGKIYYHCMMK
jgi:hypothetical protein